MSTLSEPGCKSCEESASGVCTRHNEHGRAAAPQDQGGERELVEELLHRVSPSVRKVWGDMYGVDLSNERLVALRPTREEPRDDEPSAVGDKFIYATGEKHWLVQVISRLDAVPPCTCPLPSFGVVDELPYSATCPRHSGTKEEPH